MKIVPTTIRRILHWLVWGFLAYAIVTNPDLAADIVRAIWEIISQGFRNIGRFFNQLMSG